MRRVTLLPNDPVWAGFQDYLISLGYKEVASPPNAKYELKRYRDPKTGALGMVIYQTARGLISLTGKALSLFEEW